MVLPHAAVRDVVANVVLLSVAMVAVGLRFTAKSQSGTKPQPEDWSILACLVRSHIEQSNWTADTNV